MSHARQGDRGSTVLPVTIDSFRVLACPCCDCTARCTSPFPWLSAHKAAFHSDLSSPRVFSLLGPMVFNDFFVGRSSGSLSDMQSVPSLSTQRWRLQDVQLPCRRLGATPLALQAFVTHQHKHLNVTYSFAVFLTWSPKEPVIHADHSNLLRRMIFCALVRL